MGVGQSGKETVVGSTIDVKPMNAMTPDLIAVNALDDYKLALEFADGKKGVFDCLPYMQFEFMEGLRDPLKFAAVSIDHGTVAWPEGEDLCPDDLYANVR